MRRDRDGGAQRLFADRLRSLGADVTNVRFLDARSTLETFLHRGMPDPARFGSVIGGVLREVGGPAGGVRAYGEMVDLLWRDGEPDAAIRLEELWNDLADQHTFSLLCAYPLANFYKEADSTQFERVCATHTLVRATEHAPHSDAEARERRIALLEQRAAALEMEVALRKQLERRLSDSLTSHRRSEELLRDFVENGAVSDGVGGSPALSMRCEPERFMPLYRHVGSDRPRKSAADPHRRGR